MNARFSNKKIPSDMAAAIAAAMVPVTLCKAKRKSKDVKVKATWSGSVLTVSAA